jgi:hypothetical protein
MCNLKLTFCDMQPIKRCQNIAGTSRRSSQRGHGNRRLYDADDIAALVEEREFMRDQYKNVIERLPAISESKTDPFVHCCVQLITNEVSVLDPPLRRLLLYHFIDCMRLCVTKAAEKECIVTFPTIEYSKYNLHRSGQQQNPPATGSSTFVEVPTCIANTMPPPLSRPIPCSP